MAGTTGKIYKKRRKVEKVSQDTSRTYSRKSGLDYNTGDYTLKKTKGYDDLSSKDKENRGRKKGSKDKKKRKS